MARKTTTYASAVLNLQSLKKSVNDHLEKLSEIVSWLNHCHQLDWPKVQPGTVRYEEAERSASLLQIDFMHLEVRAERLSRSCQEGAESRIQLASFQESVKAVENAKRVEKLTILATIFLPLGFTCYFFAARGSSYN